MLHVPRASTGCVRPRVPGRGARAARAPRGRTAAGAAPAACSAPRAAPRPATAGRQRTPGVIPQEFKQVVSTILTNSQFGLQRFVKLSVSEGEDICRQASPYQIETACLNAICTYKRDNTCVRLVRKFVLCSFVRHTSLRNH